MFQVHVYLHHHAYQRDQKGVYVTIYTALISQETLHKTINNETSEKKSCETEEVLNFFCDFRFALPNEPIFMNNTMRRD